MWRRPGAEVDRRGPVVAVLVLHGVIVDEARAFGDVLSAWPGSTCYFVGSRRGRVTGVGGAIAADLALADVHAADVLVVPGGINIAAAADQPDVRRWLTIVAGSARWVLSSSTGTLLLARCGVLEGRDAATHWLAGEQLAEYGSPKSDDRICLTDRFITCSGGVAAFGGALHVVRQELGDEVAAQIATTLSGPPVRSGTRPRRSIRALCRRLVSR